jgi:ribosomal 50S subunit-associated protein YjgA (DUF615 family)
MDFFRIYLFIQDPVNFNPKNNRQRTVENDDRYVAELLARYGDADESARRQWRETQQASRPQQLPPQSSKGNTETEVSLYS